MGETIMTAPTYRIRVLSYNEEERKFSSRPEVFVKSDNDECDHDRQLTEAEVEKLGLAPSTDFMEVYCQWNNFENHPVFNTSKDLIHFNAMGDKLAKGLQNDLPQAHVEPFEPLYTSLELGNCISGWWHVKDRVYGCILPVQQLPISDNLKSKLMAWRQHKCLGWLNDETVHAVNQEGHELEEHLLWELNVRELLREEMDKEVADVARRHALSRWASAESVGDSRLSKANSQPQSQQNLIDSEQ